jgi:outer membrane lipoprotein-sorting protein
VYWAKRKKGKGMGSYEQVAPRNKREEHKMKKVLIKKGNKTRENVEKNRPKLIVSIGSMGKATE